jgi:integrase
VKTPALTEYLRLMVRAMPDSLLGSRDRALLLIGFAGAFRRSELVSLDVEDLAFEREGVVVTLRRSKTDPVGQGRKIGIPLGSGKTCPVRALERWMEASRIEEGPLFRPVTRHSHVEDCRLSDKAVALIVHTKQVNFGQNLSRF